MCYCEENDKYKILKDLGEENVPEDALLNCWSSICRVRVVESEANLADLQCKVINGEGYVAREVICCIVEILVDFKRRKIKLAN